MKASLDTNVLLRLILQDNQAQVAAVTRLLSECDCWAIASTCLCEVYWVLRRSYRYPDEEIATALAWVLSLEPVQVDWDSVDAGLSLLEAGGDFSDGVIAFEGQRLGGETFVSFDDKAVKRMKALGLAAMRPMPPGAPAVPATVQ